MNSSVKILRRTFSAANALPLDKRGELPRPFSEVPGPKAIPFLGSTWKYLPLIGSWNINKLHEVGAQMFNEYGPIVREEIASDLVICRVFSAEDIEQVYKMEGRFPSRRSHLALDHYRLSRPLLYNSGGLLPTNGREWWRLRSAFQKHISALHDVRSFLPHASKIIFEFVDTFIKHEVIIDDFLPLVSRLYLELMWMYMFGKRLGSFDEHSMCSDSIPSKLINAAETVNLSTIQTDNTEKIWKAVKTPLYKKFEANLQFIERIAMNQLDEIEYKRKKEPAEEVDVFLIEKYFHNSALDRKDINGMTMDLLLGSVDTTSYSTSFLLYNLSKCKKSQESLREEAANLLPPEKPEVTADILNQALFTRAVLKESFRLNPITIGVSRYLQEDAIFSGYLIPKGTLMLTQNLVACRNEDNFPSALEFLPERWLRDSPHYVPSVSPFLVLPFSHGPRSCIARRLAEQNLLILLLAVGRKFSLSWHGRDLGIVTPLICKPDGPITLGFKSWQSA